MSLPHLASALGLLNIARRPASVCRRAPLGSFKRHLEGVLVDDLDTVDAGELREGQQAVGLVEPAIEVDLGGLGVELLAVVELDARAGAST